MNRKQLTLVLLAVVVLGGLGLWLRNRDRASYKTSQGQMGQKVLGEFDLNTVAGISVKHATNELRLVQTNDLWTVPQRGGYPANFSEVSETLRKLWELKVVQPIRIGPSQLGRLELTASEDTNSATLVTLIDKEGKPLRKVLLGKKHMRQSSSPSPFGGDDGWPDGRYVMLEDKPESASLVSETFSNLEPKPEQWLNKDFFKVEKVKSISVTYPVATNSWTLTRETETGQWTLADAQPNEQLDSSKTSSLANALSWPSFNDVVLDPQPDVTGLDNPTVAVLETFDNFTYTVKAGKKSGEDASYMTVAVTAEIPQTRTPGQDEKQEDKDRLDKEFKEKTDKLNEKLKKEKALEPWTFLVSKWSLDSLLKERHTLMADKKAQEPGETAQPAAPTPAPLVPDITPVPPSPAPSSTDVIKPNLPTPPAPPPAPTPTPKPETPPTPPAPETPPAPQTPPAPETPPTPQTPPTPETAPAQPVPETPPTPAPPAPEKPPGTAADASNTP